MSAGVPGLCSEGQWRQLKAGAIFRAVEGLDVDTLKELLTNKEEDASKWKERHNVNEKDGDGAGALHILGLSRKATYEQAQAIVSLFQEVGGDVNLRNNQQETPLIMAACYGNYGPARALVEAGASLNVADWSGRTALSKAQEAVERYSEMDENDECAKTLALIQEATAKEKESSINAKRAEELRLLGNMHYQKKDFEKAAEIYTKSLELWEDYRTYGNRSAAYLKIANYRLRNQVPGFRRHFKYAHIDAGKAVGMDKTYEKGWFREAKGYIGYRDIPRAKHFCKEGLEHCPDSKPLQDLWKRLDDLGVPDHISNPFSDEHSMVCRKLESGWMGEDRCPWCDLVVLPHPLPDCCPFCTCDPRKDVDQAEIDDLIIF